jgi:hypothetical protein
MYVLIKSRLASMTELHNAYTLDDALKLYALWEMDHDIEAAQSAEMKRKSKR